MTRIAYTGQYVDTVNGRLYKSSGGQAGLLASDEFQEMLDARVEPGAPFFCEFSESGPERIAVAE